MLINVIIKLQGMADILGYIELPGLVNGCSGRIGQHGPNHTFKGASIGAGLCRYQPFHHGQLNGKPGGRNILKGKYLGFNIQCMANQA